MRYAAFLLALLVLCAAALRGAPPPADPPQAATGPQTEKRFPPLQVPAGFQATLFACDPLIEYPSGIALGPEPGSIFVAVDYMTGLGTEIVRRDEIRLVRDSDGDGYADEAKVFASGFNSIQGLAYYDGVVYAAHSPLLTALRDSDGDGVADERRDLLSGLGLPPEENPPRLHCANGLLMGHDGWLYLALGDHGASVPRPEGDRLVLEGGGILRCRPDGSDLHVFATGLRNIYDVALDDELNVFVRDNENDGGDYKLRLCHSFFGADHGYPYLYYERPDEALPPLADLGLGSSAGGVCYLERQFPSEFHGNLFFCEWGRAVVRYRPQPAGSGFAPVQEFDFAAGAPNDPYGFKPTDIVVERDGSLVVADWADDQRPRRGRGRIYRITHATAAALRAAAPEQSGAGIARLDSESYSERVAAQEEILHRGPEGSANVRAALRAGQLGARARMHAVWILARADGAAASDELFAMARADPDPRVRAQAVRALSDLVDPVLVEHRLDAVAGDRVLASRIAELADGADARVLCEVVIALGRLRWPDAPEWLAPRLGQADPALAHAALQMLRRSQNWRGILALLDEPDERPIRAVALRALAGQYSDVVADAWIARLRSEKRAARRIEYADLLARIHQKPGAWSYWGYRPAPRPAHSVAWQRSAAIEAALQELLGDPDRAVRLATLRRMLRERVPVSIEPLERWLHDEHEPEAVSVILDALRDRKFTAVGDTLATLVRDTKQSDRNRLASLTIFARALDAESEHRLLDLAGSLEDGPVLAELIVQMVGRPELGAGPLLVAKLDSPEPLVRAAAVRALAERHESGSAAPVQQLLADPDARVRGAAAAAAGKMGLRQAVEPLLQLAGDTEPAVRRASLGALGLLGEHRGLPLALRALEDPETELAALECVRRLGGAEHAAALAALGKRNASLATFEKVVRALEAWDVTGLPPSQRAELDQAMAELHGATGTIVRWQVTGPIPTRDASDLIERSAARGDAPGAGSDAWRTLFAAASDGRVRLGPAAAEPPQPVWLAHSDIAVPDDSAVEFLASCGGTLAVWLNGRSVYHRDRAGPFQADSDRFDAPLAAGRNRLLVELVAGEGSPPGPLEFRVRMRRKGSTADREELMRTALTRAGNAERGRQLFFDAEKSQCIKCHRMGDRGERIGPELSGLGSRFTRVHIIESVLEPSRTIAPAYETVLVALKDGRLLTGTRVSETETTLVLGDSQGQKHEIARSDIDERRAGSVSTMPEGLEKRLSADEFLDLISFLLSQKEAR